MESSVREFLDSMELRDVMEDKDKDTATDNDKDDQSN